MQGRDNFLDCIRAVAALLVVCRHGGLLPGGTIGVSLFFCLSGFLIATMLIELDEPLPENLVKFVFRRFMRIWPMMVVSLLSTAILLATLRPERLSEYVQLLPGLLTYVNSPAMMTFGLSIGVLWTLQVEFWFYIMMAVIVLVAGRRALPWVAIIGIIAAWLAKLELISIPVYSWQATLLNLDELMAGVLCACAIQWRSRLVCAVYTNRALCLWTPLALIFVVAAFQFRENLTWYAAVSGAAYLTVPVILHQHARPLIGDFEPLAALGRISYSIYLMHAVIFEFTNSLSPPLRFVLMTGSAILVSTATYWWIEKPFIRWSKKVAPLDGQFARAALSSTLQR